MGHAARLTPGVERAPTLDAEDGLLALGRVVEPGVDDLAVATRDAASDPALGLERDDGGAALRAGRRRREPDDAGPDDDDVEARAPRAGACQSASPYSPR
jgi:hypothetical protein